ncbi:membrane protein, Bmp family [Treponema primitia ZAS-2]|uniref:Membrane protein, Bmp family n=1 Tax=Treponema primitia (strain ATCC BAA-887 / DSM 12427 / ZAS-2) TaxID=545694 RepID=F5YRH6_TREPZ|nr:BMP family ABC transporter substrate-binding protein [Treponema primitia]AEF84899.1 membrane protein, Bmp family [Treponema primitia ZAS-2]
MGNKMAKIIYFPPLMVLLLLLPGCHDKQYLWKPGEGIPKEKIKVGIIHPNEITETSGYDYAHYVGTILMQQELGLRDTQILRKTNVFEDDSRAVENAMRDCIAEGANIIIAASWGYMDSCEKLAAEFPGVIFAHATGYKFNRTNFTNYSGRLYQARYLSGIVAGMKTKTNKIGYVAAMGKENSEVSSGINAFALGVEKVNPAARIYVKVSYSWFDPLGEAEAARALIAAGCDVIAEHCNTPSPQITAEKAGVWGIGFNSDMSKDAPDAVLCSVILNWGVYYTYLVRSVIDGSFTSEPYFGGIADGMVDITPLAEFAESGTAEAIEKERRRMVYEGFNVFDGDIKTNEGGIIGKEGKTLDDSEIISGINWYYRTVEEIQK